jgi:formyl-CoA transferase
MAERFLRSYSLGHLLDDPRFATNEARVQHADDLDEAIGNAIASRTFAENVRIIDDNALTAAPVQTVADIEADPHWQVRQLTIDVPNGEAAVRMHNVVPRLSDTPGDIKWPGGAIGEHNVDVYRSELGLSCDEIQRLTDAGVL